MQQSLSLSPMPVASHPDELLTSDGRSIPFGDLQISTQTLPLIISKIALPLSGSDRSDPPEQPSGRISTSQIRRNRLSHEILGSQTLNGRT